MFNGFSVDDSQVRKPNLHMFWSNPSILSSHSAGSGPSDRGRYEMLQACCFGHVLHSKQKPTSATIRLGLRQGRVQHRRLCCLASEDLRIPGCTSWNQDLCAFSQDLEIHTHTDSTTPAKGPSHHRLQRLVSECGRECHFHSWWSLFQWGYEQKRKILIHEKRRRGMKSLKFQV